MRSGVTTVSDERDAVRPNPFSPSAVAKVVLTGEPPVTIATRAVETATDRLRTYLVPVAGENNDVRPDGTTAAGQPVRPAGRVLAIVGDYGSGKTHLAVHLLRAAERLVGDRSPMVVHVGYLEAHPDSFGGMYRDFMKRVDRDEVVETLRDYYADVVADALANSEFTRETARRLRNREIDPDDVVDGLGLIDSMLAGRLRRELADVTQVDVFATALTMLLRRKDLADDVWRWLTGEPPSPALADRDIPLPIRDDMLVLEAMGVFAHLYGRRHHRFVLVIDELDRALTGTRNRQSVAASFKKLFDVFQAAGAFLVVVGLPDLDDVLGGSTRQRIAERVVMPALGAQDVRRLIELTHLHTFHEERLAPFTSDTPDLIAKVSRGSARQVIRLCHRAYQRFLDSPSGVIDAGSIVRAARDHQEQPTTSRVRGEIRSLLRMLRLPFEQDAVPPESDTSVDFWITRGPAGCAVLVVPSVLTDAEAEQLAARARTIRGGADRSAAILVVVGLINSDLREPLTDAFGTAPVEYLWQDFTTEFRAVVDQVLRLVDDQRRPEESLARLAERLTWIGQQQTYSQSYLEQLAGRLEELRASMQRDWESVHGQLRSTRPAGAAAAAGPLPAPVDDLFRQAFDSLDGVAWLRLSIRSALAVSAEEHARHRRILEMRLGSRDTYASAGLVGLLRELVDAFQFNIVDWYARLDSPARASTQDRSSLSVICQGYDAVYFQLQRTLLDDYPVPPSAVDTVADDSGYLARGARVDRTRLALEELGVKVQEAMWRTLGTGPVAPAG